MDRTRAPGRARLFPGAGPLLVAGLLALAIVGCDLFTGPDSVLVVEVDGRLERGATAELVATLDGEAVPFDEVEWSATPASAVEIGPGTVRFLEAGTVVLRAATPDDEGSVTVEVAVPPEILLEAVREQNRDVFRVFLDGRDPVRLTTDPAEDRDPTSAAGVVTFVSWRTGDADLWTLPVGGGSPVGLGGVATGADERQPAVTVDGERVAFARSEGGIVRVWSGPVDGGEPTLATGGTGIEGGIEASPTWDPDGARLALVSTIAGDADVYAVEPEGGGVELLAGGVGAQVEPAWSPDGEAVVFVEDVDGDPELFLLDLSSGETTRLTSRAGADGQPSFLPDGRIVYTAFGDDDSELRWLDPAEPGTSHPIPFEGEEPENPAPVRR